MSKCSECSKGGACKREPKKRRAAEAEPVQRVGEIFVGLVTIDLGDGVFAENVIIGRTPEGLLQASVETQPGAVGAVIRICENAVAEATMLGGEEIKGWRLVRFSADGMEEVDPDDYRYYGDYCHTAALQ